jgi:LPXTG-motif cell wall-anchored protein
LERIRVPYKEVRVGKKFLIVLASVIALATLTATPALAGENAEGSGDCATVIDVPEQVIHHDAVTHEVIVIDVEAVSGFWQNFQPNHSQATFIGPPSYPTDTRGTWGAKKVNGGPQQDASGVYSNGNPAKGGNWFYRQQDVAEESHTEIIVDEEAYDEIIPAITHEECDEGTTGGGTTGETTGESTGEVDTGTTGATTGGTTGSSDTGGTTGGKPSVRASGELPHTGLDVWIPLLAGFLMVTAGYFLLRRRNSAA